MLDLMLGDPTSLWDGAAAANVPPVADWSHITAGLTAVFTDLSTDSDGSIVTWAWTFGDGAVSSLPSPSRTYAVAGTYTVRLTVTDDDGATHFKEASVTVSDPPASTTDIRAQRRRRIYKEK